jgi:dethiobiotin synthetase
MRALARQGFRVSGMKPVASGCQVTDAGLRNEDALMLDREATDRHPYPTVNPYAFVPAIAPHIAAREAGAQVELPALVDAYQRLALQSDIVVVEGAGGWRVPLGAQATLSDFPETLGLDVILVVGLRLGCLSHALLTSEAIVRGGRCRLAGWVGNGIDPDFAPLEPNLQTLRERIPAPCLGIIPPLQPPSVDQASSCLSIASLAPSG